MDLSRGLISRGHQVTLFYSRARLDEWFARELATIDGLVTDEIDMVRGISVRDPLTIITARRRARAAGPFDVVHGHSSKAGAVARLAGSAAGAVRVYTPHAFYTLGGAPESPKIRFFSAVERRLAAHCEGIICVSQVELEHARAMRLPAEKLFKVPNGLAPLAPVDRSALRRDAGIDPDEVCIGFVGRLAEQKSVARLMRAFAAAADGTDAVLAIVGTGPDEPALRALADRLGIGRRLRWLGAANGPQLMAAFDVFALSSRYEAFPYVLLEAAARRLPIVSTRVGGVAEVVRHGRNGYVVEQGDTDAFAARLRELIVDRALRTTMGNESFDLGARFDIDSMVAGTIGVYRQLLSRR